MTRVEVLSKLRTIMQTSSREKVDWAAVTEAAPIASLGFDSIAILDLIYDLQQAFKIEFEAEELGGVKTVGDLLDWLEAKIPK